MDIITLALAKNFATKIAAGYSKVEVDGTDIIFTLNDGSQVTLTVPTPADGVSVTDLDINENNELICTMSNGTTINAGEVPVADLSEYAKIEYVDEKNEKIKEELDNMKMVYNAMPKVSDEGTYLTLDNTSECPVYEIGLRPSELSQEEEPSPDNPQDTHVITGENAIKIKNSDNTQEQTCQISLDNLEYCKIGNYEDVFFKNVVSSEYYDNTLVEDKWYLKKNIGKIVLNGSENWTTGATSPAGNYRCISTIIQNLVLRPSSANVKIPMYSNCYIAKTYNQTYLKEQGISIGSNGNLGIYDNNFVSSDISLYTTWLSTHNLIVYYPLAAPTYTLLSNTLQTQLNNLSKANSYQEQTNVSQENNDLPFVIKLSAIKDISSL